MLDSYLIVIHECETIRNVYDNRNNNQNKFSDFKLIFRKYFLALPEKVLSKENFCQLQQGEKFNGLKLKSSKKTSSARFQIELHFRK